jgi:hypothetical protein
MRVVVCTDDSELGSALERGRRQFLSANEAIAFVVGRHSEDSLVLRICDKFGKPAVYDSRNFAFAGAAALISDQLGLDVRSLRRRLPFLHVSSLPIPAGKNAETRSLGLVKRELGRVRRSIAALSKEFRERDSKTPLLLPLRNFGSERLVELVCAVQDQAAESEDFYPSIRAKIDKFQSTSLRTVVEGKKTYFQNDRAIRFTGPKKAGARHGKPTGLPPHHLECLLNGVFRAGAPYDVGFHYDCTHELGQIGGSFFNCHDHGHVYVAKRDYLNIAPNDALR